MSICGIIAEYNPFHSGHAYHIAQTRAAPGADTGVVCVMSGNFVQRGAPAVFEKHARAEAAVRCGADLILELPLPWALSSAEGFARGAVGLLAATGVVTHLSFGSESGDAAALRTVAELLADPALDPLLRENLSAGMGYAAARQAAAETLAGKPLPALRAPNDILGVEYLKAIRTGKFPITPVAVPRRGAGHDTEAVGEYCSAAMLRQRLRLGEPVDGLVPPEASAIYRREMDAGRGPVFPESCEQALLGRLRALPKAAFAALPDASEGVENRLYRAAREEATLAAVLAAAGTKRYPAARLRRMLWAAALGLRKGDAAGTPPYLRVLAANPRGRELLAQMRKTAALPLLTKPAAVRALDERARRIFALEAGATDLWVLGCPGTDARRGGREWRAGPVIVD